MTRRPLFHGAGSVAGQCQGELGSVLASLSKPPEPLEGQGNRVGDVIGPLDPAADMSEVNPRMGLDPLENGEKAGVQVGERNGKAGSSSGFLDRDDLGMVLVGGRVAELVDERDHGNDLRRDRPHAGAVKKS